MSQRCTSTLMYLDYNHSGPLLGTILIPREIVAERDLLHAHRSCRLSLSSFGSNESRRELSSTRHLTPITNLLSPLWRPIMFSRRVHFECTSWYNTISSTPAHTHACMLGKNLQLCRRPWGGVANLVVGGDRLLELRVWFQSRKDVQKLRRCCHSRTKREII